MTGLPLVRLSRDGEWAVCTRVECGTRFARRVPDTSWKAEQRRYGGTVPERDRYPDRYAPVILAFLPGWVNRGRLGDTEWPGGEWKMSQRVAARISKGEQPAFRRPNRSRYRDRSLSKSPYGYPALVICPGCHQAQVADEGVLGLR